MRQVKIAAAVVLFLATSSQAAVTFVFDYQDAAGSGFNDATYGAQRRASLEYVANNVIGASLNHTATVTLQINASQTDGTGFLAQCGTSYWSVNNSFQPGFMYEHITTGVDPLVGSADGTLTVDFGYNWNIGSGSPTASQYDFQSVMLHELTHSLGFSSLISSTGDGKMLATMYSTYDALLEHPDGTSLVNSGTFTYQGSLADLTTGDSYFDGTNAETANGGSAVQLYTPNTWSDGSSISHVNDSSDPMYYAITNGTMNRTWSAIDIAILQDLGYSFVPEPATLAMLALGGAMLLARRKRRANKV